MSLPLRQILKYRNLRRSGFTVHVNGIRSITSTGRLKDARPPTPKPEVAFPKAEDSDFNPYELLRTRKRPALLRPIIFTLGVGLCTFGGAAYLTRQESGETSPDSYEDRCFSQRPAIRADNARTQTSEFYIRMASEDRLPRLHLYVLSLAWEPLAQFQRR